VPFFWRLAVLAPIQLPPNVTFHSDARDTEVRLRDSVQLGDQELTVAIADALSQTGLMPQYTVRATVASGHATLSGEIDRWGARDAIERVVARLPRLMGLTNLLVVKRDVISQELEQAIAEALGSPW
jgi:hypothetical protein